MTESVPSTRAPARFGRYLLCDPIGGGGMATVHLGRALGAGGFSRLVAIKRLHRTRAKDPRFATMLIDEARMVSRIRHPNVVPTLDVVAVGRELLLVMEYVPGLALSRLVGLAQARNEPIPLGIAARILLDVLAGLEAAHTAVSERGRALGIVHRDVSPQNVICGADGLVRVVDFGIAKAEGKLAVTRAGEIKGKVAYMAPEQLRGEEVDCRADLYAVGIVLWELLAGRRLFETSADFAAALDAARARVVPSVQHYADVPSPVEAVLMRALAANPSDRYESAATMADALENVAGAATAKDLAAFVNRLGASELSHLGARVADVEQLSEVASLAAMEASAMDPAHAQPFSTVPVTAPIAEDTIREARPSAPETSSSETAPSAPAWTPAAIANPSHAAPTRISAAPLALSSPQPVTAQPPAPSAIPQSSPQVRPAASTVSAPRRGLVLATVALLFVATMLVLAFGFRGGLVRRLLGGGRGHPSAEEPGSAPNGAERPAHPGRRRASP